MNKKDHWEKIYSSKREEEMSWTQAGPPLSLSLVRKCCPMGRVIDIGGGMSPLAAILSDKGYAVAVLDISEQALARAKKKGGDSAQHIRWIAADVTVHPALGTFDVWHDRAVFHFLTSERDRKAYKELLSATVPVDGHAIIATFAPDGPEKCSNLPVARYDAEKLAKEFAPQFAPVENIREIHNTLHGKMQPFQYVVLKRV